MPAIQGPLFCEAAVPVRLVTYRWLMGKSVRRKMRIVLGDDPFAPFADMAVLQVASLAEYNAVTQ